MHPWLKRIAAESPWLAGVGLGAWLPILAGRAWRLGDGPWGYGWPEYLTQAFVVTRRVDGRYNPFREPFHAELVGRIGDALGSFTDGAAVVSSAAMLLAVFAAGLGGRALAGPWAGAVAAASLGLLRVTADATHWGNHYPLLAGTAGLALAGSVALLRAHPHAVLQGAMATLAGVGGGLAWATDRRGLLVFPLVILAGLIPVLRAPKRRFWVLPLVILPLGLGPLITAQTRPIPAQHVDAEKMRTIQQDVVSRFVRNSKDPALQAACPAEALSLEPAALLRPCAREMVRYNLVQILPLHLPLGIWATGLALLMWGLPGRRRRWGTIQGLLAAGSLGGGVLLVMALTPMPHRYVVPSAVLLHLAAPVALQRMLWTLLPKAAPHLGPRMGLALLSGVLWMHPPQDVERIPEQRNHQTQAARRALGFLPAHLGPKDALLDCTLSATEAALLPRVLAKDTPPERVDERSCRSWIQQPFPPDGAPRSLVLTSAADRPERTARLHQSVVGSGVWTELHRDGQIVLHQWTGAQP